LQGYGSLLVVAVYEPWIAAGLAILYIFVLNYWQTYYRRISGFMVKRTSDLRRGDYFRDAVLRPHGAKEVRIFGLDHWLVASFHEHWRKGMQRLWAQWHGGNVTIYITILVPAILTGLALVKVSWPAQGPDRDITQTLIVLQAIIASSTAVTINNNDLVASAGLASATAAHELVKTYPRKLAPLSHVYNPAKGLPHTGITVSDITFSYPSNPGRTVLRDLSINIEAGSTVAVVGLNGAGKTTLVKLMTGLYKANYGSILIDGKPIDDIDPYAWRANVAVVFQEFVKVPFSVIDNLFLSTRPPDLALINQALKTAHASEMVDSLPNGLHTPLSSELTGGVDLSGGQWQRLALARAFLRIYTGAGLLILDEPTSALDARSEAGLLNTMRNFEPPVTTLLISHRFSTVRSADRIVVMDEGRITEAGSHDELLAIDGRYAEMFRKQAEKVIGASDEV
jgi:ABC-type multidrug transport system fused ATPase/permease subunit